MLKQGLEKLNGSSALHPSVLDCLVTPYSCLLFEKAPQTHIRVYYSTTWVPETATAPVNRILHLEDNLLQWLGFVLRVVS
jgi:hypothetical protein